jgi:Tol biopolymer transport system component
VRPRAFALLVFAALQLTGASGWAQEPAYPSDYAAAWSPTGRDIAFTRYHRRDLSSVYVVRSDGTRLRRVHVSRGEAGGPVWSPDGRLLAFSEILGAGNDATVRFRIARVRGGLVGRPVDGYAPAWSPDGRRIVFVRGKGLGVLDLRTHRAWRIPLRRHPTTYVGSPDWSPDGRRLAVTTGGNRVSVVSVKGGGLRLLGLARGPSWSPDGRTIAAACVYSMRAVFLSPNAEGQGCHDGAIHAQAHGPDWSPDGRKVAFSACWDPGGGCGVALQEKESTTPRRIASGVSPSWAPDGRRLVFSSARDGAVLYVINADGSRLRRLLRK